MCPLDDILDEGSKFQYSMFINFPQFIYCSHDEVYFPKLSCLIAADGGTLHSKWTLYNGCYASHSWRHKATCDVPVALWSGRGLDKILSRYILLDRYKISGRRLEILDR